MQYRLRPDSVLGLGRPDATRQGDPSPFDQIHREQIDNEDLCVQQFDPQRRASGMSSVSSEGSLVDIGFVGNGSGSTIDLTSGAPNGPNYSSGKGSRFAKFFDNKGGRESQMVGGKPMLAGLTSPSPIQGHRPDYRMSSDAQGDPRTMDDIFAMLQNSANQVSHHSVQVTRAFVDGCDRGSATAANRTKHTSCTCFRSSKVARLDRTHQFNSISFPRIVIWMLCTTADWTTKVSFRMEWFPACVLLFPLIGSVTSVV